ncbi:nitroreductase family deazaflavin-dependent oxidoreductase [Actinotalea sp. M2MS4P-6]|uniref:nitroreductase family deazaflavin-dependent oxidoreductase n=1 Tax=Actinotalea sp. M2MS4P-6 TaxID=2983762 RepID=UPI0021E3EEA9|nr:nitroreductase family deazaflavin-dependent oxidoreductase [Actinotalea sp. M2MS4P-6]MCV2393676.1 nitroreductase family deazaflavin-dependent oxidoreductase [Actinotalea sp. M2MS4P-6]
MGAQRGATLSERFDVWTVLHPHLPGLRQALALPSLAWRMGVGRLVSRIDTRGSRLVMLTVTGRKSGAPHHMPVALHELDGRPYLWCPYGSRAQWYRNLVARPVVTIQSDRTRVMRALPVEDADDVLALAADLRRFDETFWRSYLTSEGIEDTEEDLLRNADRLHLRLLERTADEGPPPLKADLAWIWAVKAAAAAVVLALAWRRIRRSPCTQHLVTPTATCTRCCGAEV